MLIPCEKRDCFICLKSSDTIPDTISTDEMYCPPGNTGINGGGGGWEGEIGSNGGDNLEVRRRRMGSGR